MSWQTVKLEDVAKTSSGGTPKRDVNSYYGGVINWVKSGELAQDLVIGSEEFITDEGLKNSSAKVMPPGTVLLAMYGATVGAVSILGIHAATNQAVCCIQPSDTLDAKYLRSYLKSIKPTLVAKSVGGAQPNLSQDLIRRLKIPLPPLSEQKRIAAILDKADELKRKREAAIAKLDQLAQSIFVEMFGKPENNDNWDKLSLQKVCELINDCPHSTPVWTESGYVALRTSNLTAGGWKWDDKRFVSEETFYERSKRGFIEAGDIVLSREGTVGIAAIVPDGAKFCMGQRLVQVRASAKFLLAPYLLQHLLYVLSPEKIGNVMVGSTSQHLNVKELRELQIPVPPLTLQSKYVKRINELNNVKTNSQAALVKQNDLFTSLQHQAFSGKL